MFAQKVFDILNAIISHSNNNDVKFQARKIKEKILQKKYQKLGSEEQQKRFYNLVQEVKLGYTTMKENKHKSTDIVYTVICRKLGIKE